MNAARRTAGSVLARAQGHPAGAPTLDDSRNTAAGRVRGLAHSHDTGHDTVEALRAGASLAAFWRTDSSREPRFLGALDVPESRVSWPAAGRAYAAEWKATAPVVDAGGTPVRGPRKASV